MPNIEGRIKALRRRIESAARAADRDPASVRLVAVSKTFPAAAVAAARRCGVRDFGENYAQEAAAKIDAVAAEKRGDCVWHFIGAIQKNKAKIVAAKFAWAHAVADFALAERLSRLRGESALPPLRVCLQVNIDGEESKAGAAPDAALPLARAVAALPHLRLRGLSAIPAPRADAASQRAAFRAVADLRRSIAAAAGIELDSLSMGMSGDFEAAIAEGATMIRIGRAVFGERPPKNAESEK